MPNARDIKRRIRSVNNIAKVTGALEAVSASKVRRAQAQAEATRDYSRAAMQILTDIASRMDSGSSGHPLLEERETIKHVAVVMLTSDRGLAGPYNSNIVRIARDFERKMEVPVQFVTVGRKGRDIVIRRGSNVVAEFSNIPDPPSLLDITPVTRTVVDDFLEGVVDEVYIAYTDYINMLRQEARIIRLLPLKPATAFGEEEEQMEKSGMSAVYTFEPDAESILAEIMPRFTELQLFQALLEAKASEHSARMVAMRNATENAEALVDDLTLTYNKARQLAITSEILDIVGGAEALAQSE